VLGEGLNRAGIKAYLELATSPKKLEVLSFDKGRLEHLLRFIYGSESHSRRDRLIRDTRELSTLAKLLESRKSAEALEKGKSLAEAAVRSESDPEARKRLLTILRDCKAVLAKFKAKPAAIEVTRAFGVFERAAKGFLKDG
jgi:hypothetical protein